MVRKSPRRPDWLDLPYRVKSTAASSTVNGASRRSIARDCLFTARMDRDIDQQSPVREKVNVGFEDEVNASVEMKVSDLSEVFSKSTRTMTQETARLDTDKLAFQAKQAFQYVEEMVQMHRLLFNFEVQMNI